MGLDESVYIHAGTYLVESPSSIALMKSKISSPQDICTSVKTNNVGLDARSIACRMCSLS